jgi:hypothetical protein
MLAAGHTSVAHHKRPGHQDQQGCHIRELRPTEVAALAAAAHRKDSGLHPEVEETDLAGRALS